MYSPSKPTAFTMASATALMLTSSSSPTVKIRDQKDSIGREVDMITRENNGFNVVIFPKHPYEEFGKVI